YAVGQKVQLTNGALNAADGASIKDMQNWIGTVKSVQQKSYASSQWQYTIEFKSGTKTQSVATVLEQDMQGAPEAKYWNGARMQLSSGALNASDGTSISAHQGWKGTITSSSVNNYGSSHYEYTIKYDNGQVDKNVLEQDFAILPADYKVGQQVELTSGALNAADGTSLKSVQGWICTVKAVSQNTYANSFYQYKIEFKSGKSTKTISTILNQDIKSVSKQAAYKVGDQLAITSGANEAADGVAIANKRGWIGKVTGVTVNNMGSSNFAYTVKFSSGNQSVSVGNILQQDLTKTLPSAKYKVGDRVRITDGASKTALGHDLTAKRGYLAVITAVSQTNVGSSNYAYTVKYDNGGSDSSVLQQDLQVATNSRFGKGSRVELTSGALNAYDGANSRQYQGWIGTVTNVIGKEYSSSKFMYDISFSNGKKTIVVKNVLDQDLKQPSASTYSVGSRVQVTNGASETALGASLLAKQDAIATVTGVTVNNLGSSHYAYSIKYDNGGADDNVLQQDLWAAPTARYKVGEQVQLSNGALNELDGTSLKEHQGWIGTIQSVTPKTYSWSKFVYTISFSNGTKVVKHAKVLEQDLQTPTGSKYRVGSRVQLTDGALNAAKGESISSLQHQIGTVTAVNSENLGSSNYAYSIKFDNGQTVGGILQQDLWDAPAAAKFKVGDNIQLTSGALEALDGTNLRDKQYWVGVVRAVTPRRYSYSNYMYQVEFTNGKQKFVINTILEQDVQKPETAAYATGTRVKLTAGANATASGASLIGRQGWAGVVTNVYATNLGSSHYAYDIRYDNGVTETAVLQQDLTK
ncbi:hypothetical protein, partial [Weissella confusa]|uniref:hypothetical protein n=1 Tax=Weissella confusa TaxID=1583 RepID=UPI002A7597D0